MLLVAKFGPKLQLAQDKNKYFIMVAIVNWSSNKKLLKFNEHLEQIISNTPFRKSKIFNYAWYNENLRNSEGSHNIDKLNYFLTEHYSKYDYEYTVSNINQIISTLMSCINDWMITYTECTDNINSKEYNEKLIKLLRDDKCYYDSLDHLYDRELQIYVKNILKDYMNKNNISIDEMVNKLGIRYLGLQNFINNNDSEFK